MSNNLRSRLCIEIVVGSGNTALNESVDANHEKVSGSDFSSVHVSGGEDSKATEASAHHSRVRRDHRTCDQ